MLGDPDPGGDVHHREAALDHLLHRLGPELIRVLLAVAHKHLGHCHELWRPDVYERLVGPNSIPGWRPSLGQTGSAQSHLAKSEVGAGDTFLFFGWFRRVEEVAGKYRYIKSEPQLHVIFGWLEVDEVLSVVSDRQGSLDRHPWVSAHPHVLSPEHYDDPKNTIYVGKSRSELGSSLEPGGGYLRRFDPMLQLTAPGKTRSIWSLPEWFHPGNGRTPMSYHASEDRWTRDQHRVLLRSVAKGQEFVVDGAEYPEMSEWASAIIRAGRA
ncbi:Nmad3 family putative nucleotide modification protein [Solilutibacter tolerans]|uniref:Nmad3 family putative nucleotide modification protein n=1 Tax=Solilutibacter tolerans TaxID=1604334 RepID=UPI001A95D8E2